MAALHGQPRTALHRFGFLKSNRFVALEKAKALLAKS